MQKKEVVDPLKRSCEYCDEPMPIDAKPKDRFCNPGCKRKYENTMTEFRHPDRANKKGQMTCGICGVFVESRRKYCKECAKRIIRISNSRCHKESNKIISEEVKMRKEALAKMSDEEFYQEVTKKMMARIKEVNEVE